MSFLIYIFFLSSYFFIILYIFLVAGHEDISPGVIPTLSVSGGLNGVSTNSPQKAGTLDALLTNSYCRNQMYLSRQLAQLHPELTMPMFSGK